MPNRRKTAMDIRTLLLHLRDNPSDRAVAQETGVHRRTVRRYRQWAVQEGMLTDPLPTLEAIHARLAATLPTQQPPQQVSSVEPYRDLVIELHRAGVEMAAMHQRLKERGFEGSYSAVRRFVQHLEAREPDAVVRVECAPGEEAQVDFGYAGTLIDPATGQHRKAWVFVMTLSHSRHQFATCVFDQSVVTWLHVHQQAFEFFGGVPQRMVCDNLKAAIVRACFEDPQVPQTYQECAQHYGFRIAPCRIRTPQHKGKVEQGGVHYVKRNFFGGRTPTSLPQTNRDLRQWCLETAGTRIHGTTRQVPLEQFAAVAQAALKPLPLQPYDLGVWKQVTVYRDCYVCFEHAFYSVPFRLIGQVVQVRGGTTTVRIYTPDYDLVATHQRATQPGERITHLDHLPPTKVDGLLWTRPRAQAEAAAVGPATGQVVADLLADPTVERLPMARRLLGLRERFGATRLEAACAWAQQHADRCTYATIKRILVQGLDQEPTTPADLPPPAVTFARSAAELVDKLFGEVARWN